MEMRQAFVSTCGSQFLSPTTASFCRYPPIRWRSAGLRSCETRMVISDVPQPDTPSITEANDSIVSHDAATSSSSEVETHSPEGEGACISTSEEFEVVESCGTTEPFASAQDAWYSVEDTELVDAATEREGAPPPSLSVAASTSSLPGDGDVLDLGELDDEGRQMMAVHGYHRVINVDVDEGGVLEDDEDNSELMSGVGFDAVLEDDRLIHVLTKDFGYETMTHVQLAAIPRIEERSDLMIQSYTGTGKTLAFLIPLVEAIDCDLQTVQVVVVAPTRELAMQIFRECERLCAGSDIVSQPLIGGANPLRQVDRLRAKVPHMVVGTPGRLAELEGNRVLRLRKVRTIVVDEVDQCMQDSFREHLECLFQACPRNRQTLFASATGDNDAVRIYAQKWMKNPELLRVGGKRKIPANIEHWCTIVPARLRIDILRRLMTVQDAPKQAICFVDDPRRVDIVCERLFAMKLSAGALRGNAHKLERAEILRLFRKGAVPLLVTTEVAARGLDVPEVTHVFNLDLPTDADHYVHRAGRTGRAGAKGVVVSIATAETAFVIGRFENELDLEITRMEPRGGKYAPPLDRQIPRGRPKEEAVQTSDSPRTGKAESFSGQNLRNERSVHRKRDSGVRPGETAGPGTPARRAPGRQRQFVGRGGAADGNPSPAGHDKNVRDYKAGEYTQGRAVYRRGQEGRRNGPQWRRESDSRSQGYEKPRSRGSERSGQAGTRMSGAELRLANKENKVARMNRERDSAAGSSSPPREAQTPVINASNTPVRNTSNSDSESPDFGFSDDREESKKKKNPSKRRRRSVGQRAKEGMWVGNRNSNPSSTDEKK